MSRLFLKINTGEVLVCRAICVFPIFLILLVNAVPPVFAGVMYVPDNHSSIQNAIDNASAGDTIIVRNGTYIENVIVNKQLNLTGIDQPVIDANYSGNAITLIADNCIVQGFILRNGQWTDYAGIKINSSSNIVRDNRALENDFGIYLYQAENNTVSNNSASNNRDGIYLEQSDRNTVSNNTCSDNYGSGAHLLQSNSNKITGNNCSNNGGELGFGIQLESSQNNTVYLNYLDNQQWGSYWNAFDDSSSNHWNSTEQMVYLYNSLQYFNYTGNYWSDYSGEDSNGDGIGDTPYNISGFSGITTADLYPMMPEIEIAPTIHNILESNLTGNSITISWETNQYSNNRIQYGLNEDLSSATWSEWHNNTFLPEITLTNLSGNTTYYYEVYSYNRNDFSLFSNSSILNFTTIRSPIVWVVDDDLFNCPNANFTKIQDAVNVTIDGDTIIVCNGTYVENVIVDRSLNITGINNPHVNANFTGSGFTLKSGGCTIQGFIISNASYSGDNLWGKEAAVRIGYTSYWSAAGVDYHSHFASSGNIIGDNYFTDNGYGVLFVWGSNYNTVTENYFENDSVTILYAKHNNVTDNEFFSTGLNTPVKVTREVQMLFSDSLHNRIENNNVTRLSTSTLPLISVDDHLDDNTISSNTLTGYGGISISSDGNRIMNNTVRGIEGLPDTDDIGIKINHAKNCVINNNTVELKYKGIYIDTSSPYTSSTNITMRNNRMSNNSYHFYLYTPLLVRFNVPNFNDFDNDIDTSNVIVQDGVEKRIYYLINKSDQTYDSANIGFFACINCNNITVKYITPKQNSHGIILYNNTNVSIENVYTHDNNLAGISVYDSYNITVKDSDVNNNGGESTEGIGINFGEVRDSRIENCLVETNWCEGIRLDHSDNNTIINSNVTDNGPGYYLKPVYRACDSGKGIRFIQSNGNLIYTNYILGITIPQQNDWKGGQRYGIYMIGDVSSNNTIYNNYFNNTVNAIDRQYISSTEGGYNTWNITKVSGVNIIGGSYLGGNYWHNYTGSDIHGEDGLGDTELPYNSAGNIINGGDYLPLTSVGNDTTSPSIVVVSPSNDTTYSANYVYLEVFSSDSDVDSWWYSIDSGSNVTFSPNTTIQGISNGQHSLTVYVNDSSGNINSAMINFTVSVSQNTGTRGGGGGGAYGFVLPVQEPLEEVGEDEAEFHITITSPEEKKYSDRSVLLSYTSPVPLRRASFILDSSSPVEVLPSASITIQRLLIGEHRITVNGEDYYGKKGRGEVTFAIIPLTLGEISSAGTPEFPEEVAFSFMGRNTDYKLTFEANVNGVLNIYLNKYLVETGGSKVLSNYTSTGELIGFAENSGWTSYELNVTGVVPDVENLITFVHLNNSKNSNEYWQIRNVSLIPALDTDFPLIKVFALDKAISAGEELTVYTKIDGTKDDKFDAYIYLISPDGEIRYYSDWGEKQTLDPYYLRNSYYGKLPSTLEFTDSFIPGTYMIVGKITEKGSNEPISLSSEKVYFNNKVSSKLYVNSESFTDGKEVVIEHALTKSPEMNGTLVISLESPDGRTIYLPVLSEKPIGKEFKPVKSEFSTVFKKVVDSTWENGTYVVRSNVYADNGEKIAEDLQIFDVCREQSGIKGRFIFGSLPDIVFSRVALIDANNLEIIEKEVTGSHYSYSINAPPGKYYLTGKVYAGDGRVYSIPFTPVSVRCGQKITRNVILEYTGILSEREMSDMLGLTMSGFNTLRYYSSPIAYFGDYNSFQLDNFHVLLDSNQDECSKPKVLLATTPWNSSSSLSMKFLERVKQSSTGIEIYSYDDIRNVLVEQERFLKENPAADIDLSRIRQMINADYILRFSYATFGSDTLLNSVILDLDNIQAVGGYSVSGSDENAVLNNLIFSQGDIGATIRAWEMTHLPPRDPVISINLNPDSVAPEEGKNELTIMATVTDCKGNPVKGTAVYFDEITERGYIKAENSKSYNGYVYSLTDSNGNAHATYVLNKGFKAGKDIVDIFTKGKGNKKVHTKAVIRITGIGIEIYADKEEVFPKGSTLLHIYLYSEDESGEKTPLSGKMILVEKYALMDGEISVVGETFGGTSNPITDESGRAILKFTAGKKEGIAKIPVRYQALSYEDSVWDAALVKVKKDEFVITLKWNENMEWDKKSGYDPPGWTHDFFESGTYSYNLVSRTVWNRQNDRETTTAKLFFNRHSDWNSKDTYCSCLCTEWGTSDGYKTCEKAIPYCDTWTKAGTTDANINSKIINVETVHAKLKTDNSGNLWIYIDPVKLKMPLKGSYISEGDWRFGRVTDPYCECAGFGIFCQYPAGVNLPQRRTIDSDSGSENSVFDYNGKTYYPYPEYNADCILVKGTGARGIGNCYYYLAEFPDNYIKLQKTGENSYRAYHYSYADKMNYRYTGFGTSVLKYDISRTFDVAVVRR